MGAFYSGEYLTMVTSWQSSLYPLSPTFGHFIYAALRQNWARRILSVISPRLRDVCGRVRNHCIIPLRIVLESISIFLVWNPRVPGI